MSAPGKPAPSPDPATPPVVAPPAPTSTPATPPSPEPPKAAAPQAPDPAPAPAPAEPKRDWKDDRIAELTAKLHDERKKKVAEVLPPKPGESQEDFDRRVGQEATRLAAANEWARQCNAVIETGKAAHPDWQAKVDKIRALVDPQDPQEVQRYNDFLAATMETGQAHEVLYSLSDNPGEARRLMALSPVKRAQAIATLIAEAKVAKEPSGAPEPITPIGSHAAHFADISPDDVDRGMQLPKAEWFARREKQAEERGLQ